MRQRDENLVIPPNDLGWLKPKLPVGTEVVCTEHNGAHTAKVVADLGFAYGVAWDLINKPENRVHAEDAACTAYDAVREA